MLVRPERKFAAGLLGIFLGAFGLHKMAIGYRREGAIMLCVSIAGLVLGFLGFKFLFSIMAIIGLIEGIIYLTKSNSDFYRTYIVGRRGWF